MDFAFPIIVSVSILTRGRQKQIGLGTRCLSINNKYWLSNAGAPDEILDAHVELLLDHQ